MQTSWEELSQLFKLNDHSFKSIKYALINKVRVIDHNNVELQDKQIEQLLTAFRVSGAYTVRELSSVLGISHDQVTKLAKQNVISSYQLHVGKGSQILFLKSEFEKEQPLVIKQSKRYNPERLMKLMGRLAEGMLEAGSLTKREFEMLTAYYLDNKTLDEIGKQYRVTRERARQLIEKYNLRLLHSMRYTATMGNKTNAMQETCLELQERIRQLEQFIKEERPGVIPPDSYHIPSVYALNVNELDLPVRVLNVFKWAKIETVMDLVDYGKKNLFNHRNIGLDSLRKVEEAMRKIGVDY